MSAALDLCDGGVTPLVERQLLNHLSCFALPTRHTLGSKGQQPAAFGWNMGDLRPAIVATNVVLIVLSLAAIACRVGRRVFLVRSFSWHDGELFLPCWIVWAP